MSSKSFCSLYLKRFSSTLIPEQCLLDGLAHPELRKDRNWKMADREVWSGGIKVDITVKIGTKCKDVCILFKFPKESSVTRIKQTRTVCGFFYVLLKYTCFLISEVLVLGANNMDFSHQNWMCFVPK